MYVSQLVELNAEVGMFTCIHYTLSSFTITKERNVIAVTLVYFPNFIPMYFSTGADAVPSATAGGPRAVGAQPPGTLAGPLDTPLLLTP